MASLLPDHEEQALSAPAQVSLGQRHTLLLSAEGKAYAFGDGAFGQLGLGGYDGADAPREIEALTPGKRMLDGHLQTIPPAVWISAGGFHSAAVLKGGNAVVAWGRGGEGQLGNEERFSIDVPKKMIARLLDDGEHEGLYGQKAVQVMAPHISLGGPDVLTRVWRDAGVMRVVAYGGSYSVWGCVHDGAGDRGAAGL